MFGCQRRAWQLQERHPPSANTGWVGRPVNGREEDREGLEDASEGHLHHPNPLESQRTVLL